jgi:glycosyltransferase involved in cell wall biosynthesis
MGRIRVIRIITRLNVGGPSLHVTGLARGLDPQAFETTLVAGPPAGPENSMEDLALGGPFRYVRVEGLRREIDPRTDAVVLARLVKLMIRLRPHVVHTHQSKAGALGRLAARIARAPAIVHTHHGLVFENYFGPLKSRVVVATERALARMSSKIIAISPAQRYDLVRRFGVAPASKVELIPLGLDLEPFLKTSGRGLEFRREFGIAESAPVVGIVGRMAPVKNHVLFVRAAALVAARVPEARFVIVGRGETEDLARSEGRRLGIESSVVFAGWRRDLERVYPAFDVGMLTSLSEGTPVSLIETLASGRPVVGTAVGGVADVVRDGVDGLLVGSGDAEGLAAAAVGLLSDPERAREMGAEGRPRVGRDYGLDRLIADVERLYSGLVGGLP